MKFDLRFLAVALVSLLVPMAEAQTPQNQWKVYQKISPCQDTRQDWFTVAQTYPGSPSTNVWQLFQGGFTFAAAMAKADEAKMGPGFGSRCCKDWGVFRNTQTGGFSVGRTTAGPQPPGLIQQGAPMCCEDAFNAAGFPVGQIRDCRNLQLSSGTTVTIGRNGKFTLTSIPGTTPTTPGTGNLVCDWEVWRNSQTGAFSLVSGAPHGSLGIGWGQVAAGKCCADAAAMVGFPASFCTTSGAMPPGTVVHGPTPPVNRPPVNPPPVNPPVGPQNPPSSGGPANLTLQLIETIPDNRTDSGWKVSNGNISQTDPTYFGQVTWNVPGAIESSGSVITIKTLAQNKGNGSGIKVSAGISGDFNFAPNGELAPVYATGLHESKSGSVQVKVSPNLPLTSGQELQLRIGIAYGPSVLYKFRVSSR